jgi:hypothetical protein
MVAYQPVRIQRAQNCRGPTGRRRDCRCQSPRWGSLPYIRRSTGLRRVANRKRPYGTKNGSSQDLPIARGKTRTRSFSPEIVQRIVQPRSRGFARLEALGSTGVGAPFTGLRPTGGAGFRGRGSPVHGASPAWRRWVPRAWEPRSRGFAPPGGAGFRGRGSPVHGASPRRSASEGGYRPGLLALVTSDATLHPFSLWISTLSARLQNGL